LSATKLVGATTIIRLQQQENEAKNHNKSKQGRKEGTEFVTQHPPVHHPLEIRSLYDFLGCG
jgi:hypothetical protein